MRVDKDWLKQAAVIVGEAGLLRDPAGLMAYNHDEYALRTYVQVPKAVVRPATEEQVAAIVKLCAQTDVPMTTRGGMHLRSRRDRPLSGAAQPGDLSRRRQLYHHGASRRHSRADQQSRGGYRAFLFASSGG